MGGGGVVDGLTCSHSSTCILSLTCLLTFLFTLKVIYHPLYSMNNFVTNKSKFPQDRAQVFPYCDGLCYFYLMNLFVTLCINVTTELRGFMFM